MARLSDTIRGGDDGARERSIESTAHALYLDGDQDLAHELYTTLWNSGFRTYLIALRRLEFATNNFHENLLALTSEFMKGWELDFWGWSVVSRVPGIPRHVLDEALKRMTKLARDEVAYEVLINRLIDCENWASVTDHMVEQALADGQSCPPVFRLHVRRRDYANALRYLSTFGADSLPKWLILETIHRTSIPDEVGTTTEERNVAELCVEGLLARPTLTPNEALAPYHYGLITRDWDLLARVDSKVDRSAFVTFRPLTLKKFESLYIQGKMDAADVLYRTFFEGEKYVEKWEGYSVLAYLLERKRITEAGALLLSMKTRGYFHFPLIFNEVKVARRAAIVGQLIEALRRSHADPYVDPLFEVLVATEIVRDRVNGKSGAAADLDPGRRNRSLVSSHDSRKSVIYACTDGGYFLTSLVFLTSLERRRWDTVIDFDCILYSDDSVPEHWVRQARRVAPNVQFRNVGEIDFFRETRRSDYGIFSGGGQLAQSAFYRIYAAEHLRRTQLFERAVYVDTDTLVHASLDELLTVQLGTCPIAGRPEERSAPISSAEDRHGIEPGNYVNSGVLVFDLNNRELEPGLHEAIRLSQDEPELLLFHDQCALNRAFRGRVAKLPDRFNRFLRPYRDVDINPEDVILHFLDQPKPWDPAIMNKNAVLWRSYIPELRRKIDEKTYFEMIAAATGIPAPLSSVAKRRRALPASRVRLKAVHA